MTPLNLGPGSVVGIATGYGLDGPGIESRWGGEIFRTCPDRTWGPTSLLYNGYRAFSGGKERPGRDAGPSPLLVLWPWKSRAIPLLLLRAIRPVQILSACTRVHFTLPYLSKSTKIQDIFPYPNPNHFGLYCAAFYHLTSHLAPSVLTPQHPYLAQCLPDSAIQCSPIWDLFTKCQRAVFTYATGEKDALQYIE